MKRDNFILFPEACGFSAAMNHLASESCSGISLEWKVYSCFIVFVLDLKGEVTNITCALQLQLHLTNKQKNQTKALNLQWAPEKDIGDRADEPTYCSTALGSNRYQDERHRCRICLIQG